MTGDVVSWHFSDMPAAPINVRFRLKQTWRRNTGLPALF
jgi:hypothetical protein